MVNHYKNKISFVDIVILISPFLIIIFRKLLLKFGVQEICLWKLLLGHKCLGCGMTTAMLYFMKGDFFSAYQTNHLSILVAPILIYSWVIYILQKFK